MSSNVVAIDQRAHAREVSAEVRRQQLAERSERVVGAIKRNRRARMMATKRWWLIVTGTTALVSVSIGAGAVWWWQQSTTLPTKTAIAVLPVAKPQEMKATQPVQPASVAVVQPSPPIPAPLQPVEASPMGRLPSGTPGNPAQPVKAVHPTPASKLAGRPTAPLQETQGNKDKPSTTQYEAPVANVSKPAIVNPMLAAVPATTPVPAPGLATTAPYQVVGVPVDGVLQIKIGKDPAIKHIRIGERLPTGEVLRKANSETGQVDTSERSFKVN